MSLKFHGHTFTDSLTCKCCVGDKRVTVIDPTSTGKLRSKFRMSMGQKWNQMRELTKLMLIKNDLLALKSGGLLNVNAPAVTHAGSKIDIFQRWFDMALQNAVLQKDASWMRPFLNEAYVIGTKFGQVQTKTMATHVLSGHRVEALIVLARVELQGIIEAVSQQSMRAVANGLLVDSKPQVIVRQILNIIETVGRRRSSAMIELLTVRAHAEASLDVYEAAGLSSVGLLPESRAQAKVVTDAKAQQTAKDAKKNAKGTGPGSRNTKSSVPSKSTINRIRRAELQTAKRLGENVNVRTAGDDDVCPVCEAISEEGPYSINTARSLIPAHPHCRCVFIPADDARFATDTLGASKWIGDELNFELVTAGLSLSDAAAIFANSWIDISDYNENHGPDGRFVAGGGGAHANIEHAAAIPREGSRKHEVYKTYLQHGREKAHEHAKQLGLKPNTASSWTGAWKREGTHGGSGGSIAPPAPKPIVVPSPKVDIPPVHVPAGGGHQRKLVPTQGLTEHSHMSEIHAGISDMPAEHQHKLAEQGLTISGTRRTTLPGHGDVLGVHRSPGGNKLAGSIEIAQEYKLRNATMKARDVRGTTVHEIGHAVDHAHGWRLGKDLESHVDADAKAGMTMDEHARAGYYFSNHKERYAELYRAAYSKGPMAFSMKTSRAREVFAKSIAHMKAQKLNWKFTG